MDIYVSIDSGLKKPENILPIPYSTFKIFKMTVGKGTSLFANANVARRLKSIMNSCRKESSDAVLHQSETAIVFDGAGCRNRK